MDEALTVSDAAAKLKVSSRHVYRLVTTGKIPAYRVGSLWRINPADLAEFAKPTAPKREPRNQRDRVTRLLRAS